MKKRKQPLVLQILHALKHRMEFDPQLQTRFEAFHLGYQNERWVDEQFENGNWLIINGLTFNRDGEYPCQADLLILCRDKILLYECKAYTQKAMYRGEKFENLNGYQYNNPQSQLGTIQQQLEMLLKKLRIPLPIESYILFTHPDFYLYNLPVTCDHFIFHSQLQSHVQDMIKNNRSPNEQTQIYFNKLIQCDNDTSDNHPIIPDYNYDSLEKIVTCPHCDEIISEVPARRKYFTCPHCQHEIKISAIAQKAFNDYQVLFDKKPTPIEFYDWCGGIFSKIRIYKMFENEGWLHSAGDD